MPKLQALTARVNTIQSPKVQTIQPGGWRTEGMTSTQRGYGYRWQQARERFLKLHPLCVLCDAANRTTAATVVDHKTPHRGDQALFWDEQNWQPLCKAHHDTKTGAGG